MRLRLQKLPLGANGLPLDAPRDCGRARQKRIRKTDPEILFAKYHVDYDIFPAIPTLSQ